LSSYKDVLAIARDIGYRFIEANAHVGMGTLYLSQSGWKEAARAFEQAIEIADDIGSPQWQQAAREMLALVNLGRMDLAGARDMAETAREYDVPLRNHNTSTVLAVVALRQGDLNTAREAFTTALNQATALLAITADLYDALDAKGLSLCGLALCADPKQIPAAKEAFQAARVVTSAAGIVGRVLQLFDALAQADTDGILAEVRPIAAGVRSE
jgi:tetratricopeptide (TPR) repeat protein